MPEQIFVRNAAHLNGNGQEPMVQETDSGITPRYVLDTFTRHWYLFLLLW